jgi:hypothetical protein
MTRRTRIAHLAGPTATIQNTPPLVTSNKARTKHGLPPREESARFDALRAQRLAAPATVYVEQFSAHPLESDAAELYGPPDGYLDPAGRFHKERQGPDDKPVFEIELHPEDGVYPLPYMARQADGSAWEEECATPFSGDARARQTFFPDGSRSFEEIDRLGLGPDGTGNLISSKADVTFHRVLPPGGYKKAGEELGKSFFPYKPYHLSAPPPRPALARVANAVQAILGSGDYDGAIWTEGSPVVEETLYWLNLVIDTTVPICGNSAQRMHGQIGNDGPKNIVDSVDYIASRVWAGDDGRDRAGVVLVSEQRIFAARSVAKVDARPGGYEATGGHGGILGAAGHDGTPLLHYVPTARHTHRSELNLTRLPAQTSGVRRGARGLETVAVPVKDAHGELLESAIPRVVIVKDGSYLADDYDADVEREVDLLAILDAMLVSAPLAGWVIEGLTPYGIMTSPARHQLALRAVFSGIPVVRVGRGATEGFPRLVPGFISGSNLTSTKARILLLAALLKLGSLPPAADPANPTPQERAATQTKVAEYQRLFDTH